MDVLGTVMRVNGFYELSFRLEDTCKEYRLVFETGERFQERERVILEGVTGERLLEPGKSFRIRTPRFFVEIVTNNKTCYVYPKSHSRKKYGRRP